MPAGKHPDLIVHGNVPFNAEPPLALLRQSALTPTELFFVRNHGKVPAVDPLSFRLSVDGLVRRPVEVSVAELRERFPPITLAATLSCAGNRRTQLTDVAPIRGELPWRDGAIGNAHWTGVRLRDVLEATEPAPEARHVAFEGLDEADIGGATVRFGGSIPVAKALESDTILAYEMNGEPLAPEHGFPLRVVVPGYIGARSVKWLARLTVQEAPSSNYFQAHAYRLFPPGAAGERLDPATGIPLGEISVNSAICRPAASEVAPPGAVRVEGWAIAAAGETLETVEVSADAGNSWVAAEIDGGDSVWSWRLWRATVELEPGDRELVARASDSGGNVQPEDPRATWNPHGYVNNAWHRVRLTVAPRDARPA